jgi:hypothetical protein
MTADRDFEPEVTITAEFIQARTAVDGDRPIVFLGFKLDECEPERITISLNCSISDMQSLIKTSLRALASFGDQPASVLLTMLDKAT